MTNTHFDLTPTTVSPQPWMQLRMVASGFAESVSRSYDPSDGQARNDALQSVQVEWTNTSPVDQWVYGLVTKSGSRVTLQCRSRGYVSMTHAVDVGTGTPTLELTEVSRFGVGSDLGNGGILNVGGAYAVSELRQHSVTMPLQPHLTQWLFVPSGETVTALVETSFVSTYWEGSMIDGGDGDTESTVVSGDVRVDLFALPVMSTPLPRQTPVVVGVTTAIEIGLGLTVAKPAGVVEGDRLLAFVGNQFGAGETLTAPAGWALLHGVNDYGLFSVGAAHFKVFTKLVEAGEPSSYAFGNDLLAEAIVAVVAVRGAADLIDDANSSGWAVASTRRTWARSGNLHVAPSIDREGQLLLCASFFGRTDYPFDLILGPAACTQTSPAGMTELVEESGVSASLNVASLANPPTPTGERVFGASPRPFFIPHAVTVALLLPGAPGEPGSE